MWIITKDLIDDGKCVGVASRSYDVAKASSLEHCFQLLDDDGAVYYEGNSDDCSAGKAFDPLDDFGWGHAGCVEIRYLSASGWEPL